MKHYFILKFNQKPGELKKFINNILEDEDDIVRFEYIKKTNKHYGQVLVGIESKNIQNILNNLKKYNFTYKKIETDDIIYDILI